MPRPPDTGDAVRMRHEASHAGVANAGFTLTELVTVIVIAGIMAAVAIPRFMSGHGFEARGFRDETVAALRYAQKSAVAARRLVCVNISATNISARIATNAGAIDCSVGSALIGPTGSALSVSAASGVQLTGYPVAGIFFTAQGKANSTQTLTVGGLPASLAIKVDAETGHVR